MESSTLWCVIDDDEAWSAQMARVLSLLVANETQALQNRVQLTVIQPSIDNHEN